MVRDDFWVSLSRFMGDLRIEILEGQNAALVDLFDLINARKVLIEFGRAFGWPTFPSRGGQPSLERLAGWYHHDPDSGVHGAAGWLLRQWGQFDLVRQVDRTATPYSPDREWFTLRIMVQPPPPPEPPEGSPQENAGAKATSAKGDTSTQSKADSTAKSAASGEAAKAKPAPPAAPPPKAFSYTFIVFQPGEFTIGSVNDEPDRRKNEVRRRVCLTPPVRASGPGDHLRGRTRWSPTVARAAWTVAARFPTTRRPAGRRSASRTTRRTARANSASAWR